VAVAAERAGERLDRVLASSIESLSRTRLKALILDGAVTIGGRTILDPGQRVNAGDVVAVDVPLAEDPAPEGQNIPLNIVYEDDDLVVIDKPAGLVVHPAPGNRAGTLVNALIHHCGKSLSGIGGVKRPGIVHRLDKDTSGLLVVAKNDRAHRHLSAQFADHGRSGPLQRGYLAFVWGVPPRPKGTIDQPIERHPHARDKMAVRAGGREAITHWQVLEKYDGADSGSGTPPSRNDRIARGKAQGGAAAKLRRGAPGKPVVSLIECRLETGRTHQIRVHLAFLGHPLLGDSVYGPGHRTKAALLPPKARADLEALGRQALHAYLLAFEHPSSGEMLEFRSELPADLACLRQDLATAREARRPRL